MKLEKKRLVLVQETLRTLTSQTTPSMQATDVSCFGPCTLTTTAATPGCAK